MVPPDSHGISRAPCYLGYFSRAATVSSTGVLPTMPALSHRLRLHHWFLTLYQTGRPDRKVPRPRLRNPCRVSHANGLASSGFARHYSRNHCCFLFLTGTEMFHFPVVPSTRPIYSGVGDRTHIRPGSPIRTPSDHSSFDSSPRPFAAYHVLHRLLVPRHPPCALKNLATKMLASTVQISNTHRLTSHHLHATSRRSSDAVWNPEEIRY